MTIQNQRANGKRFVIKDPKCGMDIMTVKMGVAACASQTNDKKGCNTKLQVTELSDFQNYFENGPKQGCDRKLHRFLTGDREGREPGMGVQKAPDFKKPALKSNEFILYFDCAQQQLYMNGKTRGLGVFQQSFKIDSDELEMICIDNCDASDN